MDQKKKSFKTLYSILSHKKQKNIWHRLSLCQSVPLWLRAVIKILITVEQNDTTLDDMVYSNRCCSFNLPAAWFVIGNRDCSMFQRRRFSCIGTNAKTGGIHLETNRIRRSPKSSGSGGTSVPNRDTWGAMSARRKHNCDVRSSEQLTNGSGIESNIDVRGAVAG